MRKILSQGKVNLFLHESENKFYSENPEAIIKALDEDCNSRHGIIALKATIVKKMIKNADGRIHKIHTDKLSVCMIEVEISEI